MVSPLGLNVFIALANALQQAHSANAESLVIHHTANDEALSEKLSALTPKLPIYVERRRIVGDSKLTISCSSATRRLAAEVEDERGEAERACVQLAGVQPAGEEGRGAAGVRQLAAQAAFSGTSFNSTQSFSLLWGVLLLILLVFSILY